MRKIGIVGAGQAGLQLGIGLLKQGYQVTLVNSRSAEEILHGRIMSNQGMFYTALQHEKALDLNYWEESCPKNRAISFVVANSNHQKALEWKGTTREAFQAIDQRIKFSFWLKEFIRLGGRFIHKEADVLTLEDLAATHDLTIVAGGKGEISNLFKRDDVKSEHTTPPRALACLYVNGMQQDSNALGLHANIIPDVGEYFAMPGLTLNGPCEMMLFEGIPGSDFDGWEELTSPAQQLEKSIALLEKYVPWEATRCKSLKLTDDKATLVGRYTPIVRHPFIRLPSGKLVLGMGDTIVLNDPIAGQGANNASKCAHLYLNRIMQHKQAEFTQEWMQETFDLYWEYAKWPTAWTNLLLKPLPPHVLDLLAAAKMSKHLANLLATSFDNLKGLYSWINNPEVTYMIINFFQNENKEIDRSSELNPATHNEQNIVQVIENIHSPKYDFIF